MFTAHLIINIFIMKNLKKLGKTLNRNEQKAISGGSFGYPGNDGPLCPTPNAFFCNDPNNIAGPGHVCCRGLCVLPTHGACTGIF